MDSTQFRRALLRRILDVVGAAAVAAPAIVAGCGGKVVVDQDGETIGIGGAGGTSGTGLGGYGGAGGFPDAGCALTTTGTGAGQSQVTECITPPPDGCPNQYNAAGYIFPSLCVYLVSVNCGPIVQNGQCCYVVTEEAQPCGTGRPFYVAGAARTARARRGDGGWIDKALAPAARDLPARARAALSEAWTRDALLEHASVASFSRFSLELLAAGAPADLVGAAHRAALDEVRHARLCFALASAYGGEPIAPSPLAMEGAMLTACDLPALAAETARDAAIGETLSAILAAEQLARATDPAVRRALTVIAEDEARHAELAWRTLAWAVERGGAPVRAALRAIFSDAARHFPVTARSPEGVAPEIAAAHGRLDHETACEVVIRGLAEVVLPSATALLGHTLITGARDADGPPVTQRSAG